MVFDYSICRESAPTKGRAADTRSMLLKTSQVLRTQGSSTAFQEFRSEKYVNT
jgi:hypothetical protein